MVSVVFSQSNESYRRNADNVNARVLGQIPRVPAAGEGCWGRWVTLERWEGAPIWKD